MSYLPELRASLVRAADRQRAPASTPERRRSLGWLASIGASAVAVAVVVLAIVLLGHVRHATAPPHPNASSPPPAPNLSNAQWTLIQNARNAVVAHDRPCWPFEHLPPFSQGSPGPALTSLLGVLRKPATPADSLPRSFFAHGPGGIYARSIRRSLDEHGVALYIVPTAGLGFRPVPARCAPEERAALARRLGDAPGHARLLDLQQRYLRWQQYVARHAAICLAEVDHGHLGRSFGGGSLACGWSVPEIVSGMAGLGTGPTAPGGAGLFHGIVPDGVARVTAFFDRRGGRERAVSGSVTRNVYLVRVPRGLTFPTRVVWYAADGRAIRSTRVP
jgi:hypothetical protein